MVRGDARVLFIVPPLLPDMVVMSRAFESPIFMSGRRVAMQPTTMHVPHSTVLHMDTLVTSQKKSSSSVRPLI